LMREGWNWPYHCYCNLCAMLGKWRGLGPGHDLHNKRPTKEVPQKMQYLTQSIPEFKRHCYEK